MTSIRSFSLRRLRGAIAVALPFAGCSDAPRSPAGAITTVDTIAGIVHIRSAGSPARWQAIELLTLGSAGLESTEDAQAFARITGVLGDAAGRIYVADGRALEIRVFDADGTVLDRFGAEGAGPGEFGGLQSIAWLGDTLLALDPGNARLGMFSPDGAWLDHRPYMALTGSSIRLFSAGPRDVYMPFYGRIGEQRGLVFVRQRPGGAADTLSGDIGRPGASATSDMRDRIRELTVRCTHSAGQGISTYSADLAPEPVLVPAPDGLRAAAWGATYRIAFLNAVGDTVRIVERDVAGDPLGDEEWRAEERRFEEFLDRFSDETCEPRSLPRPPERRLLLGIFFDQVGRMWVERENATTRAFDIFHPDGTLLATLDYSPPRLERVPPHIREDRFYIVVTDSLDIEYVKVFRIDTGDR
ncbi:MAG: hypothetical protein ACREL7_01180 [Longimicrobiales bacterium]